MSSPYLEIVFLVCIGVTAVSTIATLVSVTRLLGILRRQNPAEFERLGSPHVIFNNTLGTNRLVYSFLNERQYEALGDPAIRRAAATTRKLYIATFGLFALSLALLASVWIRT